MRRYSRITLNNNLLTVSVLLARQMRRIGVSLLMTVATTVFCFAQEIPPSAVQSETTSRELQAMLREVLRRKLTVELQSAHDDAIYVTFTKEITDKAATAVFRREYASAMSDEAMIALNSALSVEARLRIAAAVFEVAQKAGNDNLCDVVERLTRDDAADVAMLGVRASRNVIIHCLWNRRIPKALVESVLVAARRDGISFEAYRSLLIDNSSRIAAIAPKTLSEYVQYPLRLIRFRRGLFNSELPHDAAGEIVAADFLGDENVWRVLTDQERKDASTTLMSIAEPAMREINRHGGEQETAIRLLQEIGGSLKLIGQRLEDENLIRLSEKLRQVKIGHGDDGLTLQR